MWPFYNIMHDRLSVWKSIWRFTIEDLLDQIYFFTRKLSIIVIIITESWIFSTSKYIIYKDNKSKCPSMESCRLPDVIFRHILKQFQVLHLCFLSVRWFLINSKVKLSRRYASCLAITLHKKWGFSLRISSVNVIKSAVFTSNSRFVYG